MEGPQVPGAEERGRGFFFTTSLLVGPFSLGSSACTAYFPPQKIKIKYIKIFKYTLIPNPVAYPLRIRRSDPGARGWGPPSNSEVLVARAGGSLSESLWACSAHPTEGPQECWQLS